MRVCVRVCVWSLCLSFCLPCAAAAAAAPVRDVLFCHRPDPDTPIEETVRAMNWVIDQVLFHTAAQQQQPGLFRSLEHTCRRPLNLETPWIAAAWPSQVSSAFDPDGFDHPPQCNGSGTGTPGFAGPPALLFESCGARLVFVQGWAFYWGTSEWSQEQLQEVRLAC